MACRHTAYHILLLKCGFILYYIHAIISYVFLTTGVKTKVDKSVASAPMTSRSLLKTSLVLVNAALLAKVIFRMRYLCVS